MSKAGIITFHRSYNCGSMLQAFALQQTLIKMGLDCEIVDFSNEGQRQLYSLFRKVRSLKDVVKNLVYFAHRKRIESVFEEYELFIKANFKLSSRSFRYLSELDDGPYDAVITGSDQVWNALLEDGDDAYFLPWVNNSKKIAYAPSFGARDIFSLSSESEKYIQLIREMDAVSVREENGRDWIRRASSRDVPVVLDPTLLLDADEYNPIEATEMDLPEKYIFYYSPGYEVKINHLVKAIADKYELPVIAFNSKTFYMKGMGRLGFTLPKAENPSAYLALMRRASLVVTTSFHGTIFSTIYRRCFWTIENEGMLGEDDRVRTLVNNLNVRDRLVGMEFDPDFDYLKPVDYASYDIALQEQRGQSFNYLKNALGALLE